MSNPSFQTASLTYRRAATQHASVAGLVIALHDTLAGDLRRAADAIDRNDIQTRCDQLLHGFKVLQQLEAMLDMRDGGETASKVQYFYNHVRGQMLAAQFKLSAVVLRDQARIVAEVREAWQKLDSSSVKGRYMENAGMPPTAQLAPDFAGARERLPFSCCG